VFGACMSTTLRSRARIRSIYTVCLAKSVKGGVYGRNVRTYFHEWRASSDTPCTCGASKKWTHGHSDVNADAISQCKTPRYPISTHTRTCTHKYSHLLYLYNTRRLDFQMPPTTPDLQLLVFIIILLLVPHVLHHTPLTILILLDNIPHLHFPRG
jgi:hypothetical protein